MIDHARRPTHFGTAAHALLHASLLWGCGQASLAQTPPAEPAAIVLRDGQTVSASHRADQAAIYLIDAREGSAYLIRVDQRGLDLIVTLEDPAGSARSFDSPLFRDGPEFLLLEPATTGEHRITLHSDEHTGATGGHAIRYTELGPATPSKELAAWRLVSAGGAANFESGEQAWADAVGAYSAAAQLWGELERERERAHALFGAATIEYWQLYDWDTSAELAAAAAQTYRNVGDEALAANAVHLQAAALVEKALEAPQSPDGDGSTASDALFDEALRLFGEARAVHERLGNVYDLGLIVNNLGYTEYNRGRHDQARSYYQEAAALMQNADEWTGELNPRSNLAVLDAEAGYLADAIDTWMRIVDILPEGKLLRYRADALDNLGLAQQMLGRAEAALRTFSAALEIQRSIDDLQGEGRTLRGMGQTYFGLGELELARQYLEQALPLAEQTNDGRTREAIHRVLGEVAYLESDYEAALTQHRMALAVVSSATDRTHLQLLAARDLRALRRTNEAAELARVALTAAEEAGIAPLTADALHEAGRVLFDQKDLGGASELLGRAAALYDQLGLRARHAQALNALALAAHAQGELARAIELNEVALAQIESLRLRVADPELRAFFSASRRSVYETHADLLMTRGSARSRAESVEAAFEISERARARSTADLLNEAAVELRRGFDPDLRERESSLIARLADLRHRRDLLLRRKSANSNDPRLTAVLAELTSVENDLNLLQIELRRRSPDFAALTAPRVLTGRDVQASLEADSVLLQYMLGDARSYVWVVTQSGIVAAELADRQTIERAARRALESLRTYRPDAPSAADQRLARLAELVLAPVADRIDGSRVVVALDGALQYIPFGVLPMKDSNGSSAMLLHTHEVVGIPSMSALAARAGADPREPPARTLAVFADPVLEPGDPRLNEPGRLLADAPARSDGLLTRSSVVAALGRLPATAGEADRIAALVPDEERFVARGFAANRDVVVGSDLTEYRYIHFATHGFVDARYPSLSALALSQFDDQGVPRNGFLRLNDIYNLRLNADLVVLSACETALGRDVRGEGLIGLTQGFMSAGARSVVATLWQVPDRSTAELMARFYAYMFDDGLRPSAALRAAQLDSAADRRWTDPYFWGGFVLVGDWK